MLALLSAGLGLLVERALATRLPASLLVPAGFALLVALTTLATLNGWSARLATPGAVALAIAGAVLGAPARDWRLARWGAGAVLAVFAVGAAPVVLTGQATFAGYTHLDDISTFLSIGSHVIEHGRDVELAASTAEATIRGNLDVGYPVGSFVALEAAQPLVGTDSAWLWQPYLTFMLAVLASSLWTLAAPLARDLRLRALAVFLAAQPALLYAYALQGGVKELATAALAALAAALAAELVREPERVRLAVPLAIAAAAIVCVLGVGAVPYLGMLAAGTVVAALLWNVRDRPALGRFVQSGATAVAILAVLALPLVSIAATNAPESSGLLENREDLGNLFAPLDWKQIFGIWPVGDYRLDLTGDEGLVSLLILVAAVAAVAGVAIAFVRRAAGPLILAACVAGAAIGLTVIGSSPWVDAKALAIASPAVVLLAVLGACAALATPARALGAIALAAIGFGVLWSNWLAYRDVRIAPRDRLAELAEIGDRFAGEGPTLLNEYEPYGARYFLRRTDAEAPAELRRRVVPLRRGTGLDKLEWAPVDEFQPAAALVYRTVVLRRSPAESRPLPEYELRYEGDYYDVWQRPEQPVQRVIEQSMFGDRTVAVAPAPCAEVRRLARVARDQGATLVAAERPRPLVLDLASAARPASWTFAPGRPAKLFPTEEGTATLPAQVESAGDYDVWVQGSFARGLEVSVDGERVGLVRDQLNFEGLWNRFGSARVSAGRHTVELRYPGSSLRPGSGDQPQRVGPVALVPVAPTPQLGEFAAANAASLCGRALDWLAVIAAP
ncbi:MAG TPA: hypothetical protein VF712_04270 [Thermoleophilaceae bacterium]